MAAIESEEVIVSALRLLVEPGELVEIRALAQPGSHFKAVSGVFDDIDAAAAAACGWGVTGVKGVYYGLNVPSRAGGIGIKSGVSDADIIRRRWLLVDIDSERPDKKEANASDEEIQHAIDAADRVQEWMESETTCTPLRFMSGNGVHLLYSVQLENSEDVKSAVQGWLAELARRFDTSTAKIDVTVCNASRIARLPGTVARKGPYTVTRPQRMATILSDAVSGQVRWHWLLQWLPQTPEAPAVPRQAERGSAYDRAQQWMAKRGPAIQGQQGNPHTFRTATKMVIDFALSDEDALELLSSWNVSCQPPWTEKELRGFIKQAHKSGTHQRGAALDEPLRKELAGAGQANGKIERPPLPEGATLTPSQALVAALKRLLAESDPWEGTSQDLWDRVLIGSNTKALGRVLGSAVPDLQAAGITVCKEIRGPEKSRVRMLTITRQRQNSLFVDQSLDQVTTSLDQDGNRLDQDSADQDDHADDQDDPYFSLDQDSADQESVGADQVGRRFALDQDLSDQVADQVGDGPDQEMDWQKLSSDYANTVKVDQAEPPSRPPGKKPGAGGTNDDGEEKNSNLCVRLKTPKDYPVLLQPLGYKVQPDGIYSGEDGTKRLDIPCLITDRLKNISDGTEHLVVAHRDGYAWHKNTYPRRVLADGRTAALEMAEKGYPVTSEQGKSLANYIHKFYLANQDELPAQLISNNFGWQGPKGSMGFLLGRSLVGGESATSVQFVAQEGLGALADGVAQRGRPEVWEEAFRLLQPHDRPMLCLYASFSAPLVHIVGANSFVIDLCGETSRGKTTVLKACASVWGTAEIDTPSSLIQSWNSTPVAIETRASTLRHLPILLDDTNSIPEKDRARVGSVVYMLAGGQGRQRGSLKGMRVTGTWNTIAISTGEARISQMSTQSGKNTRLLTLWGHPFDGQSSNIAQDVKRISTICRANHGHIGRQWVEWLEAHKSAWPQWQERLHSIRQYFSTYVEDKPEADRITEYLAVIELGAQLVHECFPHLAALNSPTERLLPHLVKEVASADVPEAALRTIYDWSCSNSSSFFSCLFDVETREKSPIGGWSGKWNGREGNIGFFRTRLDKVLQDHGFSPEEIVQRWADRGYLEKDPGRITKVERIGYQCVRLLVLRYDVIVDVCKIHQPEPTTTDEILQTDNVQGILDGII